MESRQSGGGKDYVPLMRSATDDDLEADDLEVDDILKGKQLNAAAGSTRFGLSTTRAGPLLLLTLLFVAVVVVSNAVMYRLLIIQQQQGECRSKEYYLEGPDHRYESKVTRPTVFLTDGFGDANSTISDALWRTMFPEGDGVVVLSDEVVASMNLPPSIRVKDGTERSVYLVSAFHHMHCISLLRYLLYKYYSLGGEHSLDEDGWHHTRHCLDVLREHVMCRPDETLLFRQEGMDTGVGQARVCKNFDALKKWAGSHYLTQ